MITETSPRDDWQWLIFAYVVRDFDGEVASDYDADLRLLDGAGAGRSGY